MSDNHPAVSKLERCEEFKQLYEVALNSLCFNLSSLVFLLNDLRLERIDSENAQMSLLFKVDRTLDNLKRNITLTSNYAYEANKAAHEALDKLGKEK